MIFTAENMTEMKEAFHLLGLESQKALLEYAKEPIVAKKIAVALFAAMVVVGAAGAQEKTWYNSYAPGVEGSSLLINAGVGYGMLPYKMSLPPISASVEYALLNIPLSIGGYFGMTGYKEDLGPGGEYKGSMMGFGAKASWHFNFGVKNLDPYVSLLAGWLVYNQEVTTTVKVPGLADITITAENNLSTFLYGGSIGTRFFFTNNLGVYLELGYSAISVASVGLTLKF